MTAPLIILEGGDCAGKTTLSNQLREAIPEAHYVHYSDYKHVKKSLPRMYVEGMMPAVLGHAPVIMDRCWLSEEPYCRVFRPTESPRLDWADVRMLERLALSCEPIVIYCDPGWKVAREKFMERKGKDPASEYLDNEAQLKAVRDMYSKSMQKSHLNVVSYNWTNQEWDIVEHLVKRVAMLTQPVSSTGAPKVIGSSRAQLLIVGDSFAKHQEFDPHYQWPFASFSRQGCSRWLATQLDKYGVKESYLKWVNQNQLGEGDLEQILVDNIGITSIITLGDEAKEACKNAPQYVNMVHFPHPQWWKRFNHLEPYSAAVAMKELIVA